MGLILDLATAAVISQRQQPPAQTVAPAVYNPTYIARPGVLVGAGPGRLSGRRMLRAERVAYLSQAMAPTPVPSAPAQPCPGGYYVPPEHYNQPIQQQFAGSMQFTCQGPADSWRDVNQPQQQPQQQQQWQQWQARDGFEYNTSRDAVRMEAPQFGGEPPTYGAATKKI